MPRDGWPSLFAAAFAQSRNPMALVDEHRSVVDVNAAFVRLLDVRRGSVVGRPLASLVVDGPLLTQAEWAKQIAAGRASGEAALRREDGGSVGVQWAATAEEVTGRRLVLLVALNTSRWGGSFRRQDRSPAASELSPREIEIVRLVAAGSTAGEIADDLRLSHHTVRTHVRNAMDKLGARSRAHLVAQALGRGHALL
jgi:PAS domain S-box-containing protein